MIGIDMQSLCKQLFIDRIHGLQMLSSLLIHHGGTHRIENPLVWLGLLGLLHVVLAVERIVIHLLIGVLGQLLLPQINLYFRSFNLLIRLRHVVLGAVLGHLG